MADPKDKPERQESLPFPPTPSASIAGRTMQESDLQGVLQRQPERLEAWRVHSRDDRPEKTDQRPRPDCPRARWGRSNREAESMPFGEIGS